MRDMVPCKCGGTAKYVSSWGMDDQFICSSCDYKTKNYFDGAEYAAHEWKRRNDPDYVDPMSKRMATLRDSIERRPWLTR